MAPSLNMFLGPFKNSRRQVKIQDEQERQRIKLQDTSIIGSYTIIRAAVVGITFNKTEKQYSVEISVMTSAGSWISTRTETEFRAFDAKLCDYYGHLTNLSRTPTIPRYIRLLGAPRKYIQIKLKTSLELYLQNLIAQPEYVSKSKMFLEFFSN